MYAVHSSIMFCFYDLRRFKRIIGIFNFHGTISIENGKWRENGEKRKRLEKWKIDEVIFGKTYKNHAKYVWTGGRVKRISNGLGDEFNRANLIKAVRPPVNRNIRNIIVH